eukprot:4400736-Prymnesium_polylepis.1
MDHAPFPSNNTTPPFVMRTVPELRKQGIRAAPISVAGRTTHASRSQPPDPHSLHVRTSVMLGTMRTRTANTWHGSPLS